MKEFNLEHLRSVSEIQSWLKNPYTYGPGMNRIHYAIEEVEGIILRLPPEHINEDLAHCLPEALQGLGFFKCSLDQVPNERLIAFFKILSTRLNNFKILKFFRNSMGKHVGALLSDSFPRLLETLYFGDDDWVVDGDLNNVSKQSLTEFISALSIRCDNLKIFGLSVNDHEDYFDEKLSHCFPKKVEEIDLSESDLIKDREKSICFFREESHWFDVMPDGSFANIVYTPDPESLTRFRGFIYGLLDSCPHLKKLTLPDFDFEDYTPKQMLSILGGDAYRIRFLQFKSEVISFSDMPDLLPEKTIWALSLLAQDIHMIRKFLEHGMSLLEPVCGQNMPLHIFFKSKQYFVPEDGVALSSERKELLRMRSEALELLLNTGADLNAIDSNGDTPINLAMAKGDTHSADILRSQLSLMPPAVLRFSSSEMQKSAEPKEVDETNNSALQPAIKKLSLS